MIQVQHLRYQKDQFTALGHIYMDQFHVVKETAPYKFNVTCKPYKGKQHQYQINLMFQYTKQYPYTPIKYQIEPVAGITRDNTNHIIRKIEQIINNSRQKPVVFDIVEETRNWIHQYLVDGKAYEEEQQVVTKNIQIFQRPKFAAFTPVTVQNFLVWKKDFEMRHRSDKQKIKKEVQQKLSGKQWFLGKHGQVVQSQQSQQDEQQQQQMVQGEKDVINQLFQN